MQCLGELSMCAASSCSGTLALASCIWNPCKNVCLPNLGQLTSCQSRSLSALSAVK